MKYRLLFWISVLVPALPVLSLYIQANETNKPNLTSVSYTHLTLPTTPYV